MTREMKDSGIEWIGQIPEGWNVHRIKNHYSIISGSGFRNEIQGVDNEKIPVCKASDISKAGHRLSGAANSISETQKRIEHFSLIPPNSILFAKIGEAMKKNNRTLTMLPVCADNNCQAMVPINIDYEYSYYLFCCIDMTWFDNAGTIPCINNTKLLNSNIPYPDISMQKIIASFLDSKCSQIDSILTSLQDQIGTLEQYKKSIITEAVTKGLNPDVEMKDSGIEWIRKIPFHWKVDKIKYHLTRKEPKNPGDKQVLSVYREYGVIPKDSRSDNHNVTSEDTSKYKYVTTGNLVINKMKAWQGSLAVSDYEGIVSPAYFIYKFTDEEINKKYFHFLIRSCYKDEFRRISGGIREGQWDLPSDLFENELILLPPLKEQQQIVNYLDIKCSQIDSVITQKKEQMETLKEYKKSLIYEYVTGKKEVPNA